MVAYVSECYLNVHHYYFCYSYMVACSSKPLVITVIFLAFAGRGSNNVFNKNNWPTGVCGLGNSFQKVFPKTNKLNISKHFGGKWIDMEPELEPGFDLNYPVSLLKEFPCFSGSGLEPGSITTQK